MDRRRPIGHNGIMDAIKGRLTRIATFNLHNLLPASTAADDLGAISRAALEARLAKLTLAIANALDLPALIAVQEVGTEALLGRLAALINARAATDYAAIAPPTSDRRGIRVGFLWDRRRVRLIGAHQLAGAAVAAAFGPDSPSPGREPLVADFALGPDRLRCAVLHLKSDYVPLQNNDRPDAVRAAAAAQRRQQARVLRAEVDRWLRADADLLALVAGDINAGPAAAAPPDAPEDAKPGPVAILAGPEGTRRLTNLWALASDATPASFVGDRGPVLLDHLLASPALYSRAVTIAVLPLNTTAPPDLALDPTTPARCSDHDPVIAGFRLGRG